MFISVLSYLSENNHGNLLIDLDLAIIEAKLSNEQIEYLRECKCICMLYIKGIKMNSN